VTPATSSVRRVLVVDDDEAVATLVQMALALDDRVAVVGVARNGAEALERARELRPDVIVMDVQMPILDGLEATRRLRAAGCPAVVVILSGHMGDANFAAAYEAGAVAVLQKPVDVHVLQETVASAGPGPDGAGA
jgi:CheY-like chemotaxis protein